MIKVGKFPFYECSSRGDIRFSAFGAFVKARGNSIENLYQAAKVFEDGTTGLSWRAAKGRRAVNMKEVHTLYVQLWKEYLEENPELLPLLKSKSGLSDMFGQPGNICQAIVLWNLRNTL